MHSYLRSIGFKNIKTKKDWNKLIQETIISYDKKKIFENEDGEVFAQLSKLYAENMGITVCGEYNEDGKFEVEYYFPFLYGTGITSEEDILVERHAALESYAAVCEDVKVGVSLIFYLQNVCEYKIENREGSLHQNKTSVTLSGLAMTGKILLPIIKDEDQLKITKEASRNRNQMIAKAKKGDEEAIESLTLEDIDTYSMVCKRILNEDVFTLVDSFFMPYGIECDQYSVMGEIMDFKLTENTATKEEIYIMTLNSNELVFDICINKSDLLGEPLVGRRFKGTLWLQGKINYNF